MEKHAPHTGTPIIMGITSFWKEGAFVSKHTPGPWEAIGTAVYDDSRGRKIADCMQRTKKKYANWYMEIATIERLKKFCKRTGRVQGIFVEKAIQEKLEREEG